MLFLTPILLNFKSTVKIERQYYIYIYTITYIFKTKRYLTIITKLNVLKELNDELTDCILERTSQLPHITEIFLTKKGSQEKHEGLKQYHSKVLVSTGRMD